MILLFQENIAYVRVTQLVGLGWLPEALVGCLPVSCLAPGNVGLAPRGLAWLPAALQHIVGACVVLHDISLDCLVLHRPES